MTPIIKRETAGTGGLLPHQCWAYWPGVMVLWFIVDLRARLQWREPRSGINRAALGKLGG